MIHDDTLIYDIETKTFGRPDGNKDIMKIFGCYSYKTKKSYLLTNKDMIQKVINSHKYLVGFNNIDYDNKVLVRSGIDFKYKYIIDLLAIIKRRKSQMKVKKGMLGDILMNNSLKTITETLELVDKESGKGDIDYNIFKKDNWTKEEIKLIAKYTKRDIEITRKLYEWVEEYFEGFKPFVYEKDIKNKKYLTSSIAGFAYKAMCKAMGWEERYGEMNDDDDRIKGGYVSYPLGEQFEGDIFCLDYNSLYPHVMIQCNLYGRKEGIDDKPFWNGGNKWRVEGNYYSDKLSGVGELFRRWYKQRSEYKKANDKKEYTIKIILNASYGILNNPYYSYTYDRVAGGDCTRLARQWILFARKKFREAGYKNIYTDTDSCYVLDVYHDKEKLLKVKDEIINEIKKSVPFPQDTFDMGIDDEIKYMFFFRGKQ